MKNAVLCIGFLLSLVLALAGCSKKTISEEKVEQKETVSLEKTSVTEKTLPIKNNSDSMLMSQSPIKPDNLDDYLFREDSIYVDLRTPDCFYKDGHVAGFTNVPFYGFIAGFPGDKKTLFEMKKKAGLYLGEKGTFSENYEDSAQIIYEAFDKSKNIIAISTAGVESCYFLNLLVQLGYNPEKLYNAGSFTNGMGQDIAYRTYKKARYLVKGMELYDTEINFAIKLK